MNLRQVAERHLGRILENQVSGFGWPITVTDPSGTSGELTGFSNDIAQVIDPDTGIAVSGRSASVALRISSLSEAGLGLPIGVAETASKPWLITFEDINGNSYTFKVSTSNPDRMLGVVICLLELYE